MTRQSRRIALALVPLIIAGLCGNSAFAQQNTGTTTAPVVQWEPPAQSAIPDGESKSWNSRALIPVFSPTSLAWITAVLVLVLTVQPGRLWRVRALDGLVLGAVCLLWLLRGTVEGETPVGSTGRWWAYLLLTLVALYWFARGVWLMMSRESKARVVNTTAPAMRVLVLAAVLLASQRIATAPLSDGSRDGIIGGVFTAQTGRLPYGDAAGNDARSPLLYLAHAGAIKLVDPTFEIAGNEAPLTWATREVWTTDESFATIDRSTVLVVNGTLFVLVLIGLWTIGSRLHSAALAQTLIAVFCLLPPVLECLAWPEIMLPTVLLTWSIAFALVPGVGGVFSALLLVLAGMAWPWAWLALPPMCAYFWRHNWQALGATAGSLGGIAACLAGLTWLTGPTIPRSDAALREASLAPQYSAAMTGESAVMIEHLPAPTSAPATMRTRFWKELVEAEDLRLNGGAARPSLPTGVDRGAVRYRDVVASGEALRLLQLDYRSAMLEQPEVVRMWVAVRSVLEATWRPVRSRPSPLSGTWELWAESLPASAATWTWVRRTGKGLACLLSLVFAFVLWRGERPQPHQLIGAVLAIASWGLLVSMTGPATNLAWVVPAALAAMAAHAGPSPEKADLQRLARMRPPQEPAPRITVEN